jgi:predicted RNA-binding protein associated with RNAse of E/G family
MENPVLFRRRLIPPECICLKDDEILYFSENEHILVTKWHALKPRNDLHHGYSCYFWDKGFKVSKFYQENGDLLYWYCDIIDVDYPAPSIGEAAPISGDAPSNIFIATDLLADVIIYPDGFVKVVDLDELTMALDNGSLSLTLLKTALTRLDSLLNLIYTGEFQTYQNYLDTYSERVSHS